MRALMIALAVILVLTGIVSIAIFTVSEPEPEGRPGVEADALARNMLAAMDVAGWDTTRYLHWVFRTGTRYVWDREHDRVLVVSEGDSVILNARTVTGRAYSSGIALKGDDLDKAVASAWRSFCNDGFWLYAPFKVFDPGTVRSIVTLEDGSEALKVTYMEGGVTPGDSYLWILDEHYRPKAWKMWVSIFPIGGVEFSWDGWQQLPTGAWLSTIHDSKVFTVDIREVRSGQTLEELGIASDPFRR